MSQIIQPSENGVPLKAMLEALEHQTGFTDEDEINQHDQRIKFMDEQNVQMQVLSYGNGSPSYYLVIKQLNYAVIQMTL